MLTALKPPYQYVIDSSALFDLKNQYPKKIFPGIWERLEEMFHYRLIIAPREVLREIKNGNDELVEWAGEYEDNFLEPADEEYMLVQDILLRYPENIITKYSFRPWADPFVIACAKHYRLPIIQHETNDPNQFKIPSVAKKYNIECIRLIQFFEEENWSFITA